MIKLHIEVVELGRLTGKRGTIEAVDMIEAEKDYRAAEESLPMGQWINIKSIEEIKPKEEPPPIADNSIQDWSNQLAGALSVGPQK